MDVHHHSHLPHQSKPWKQYLTEGLMIFVAVMLGYAAENVRHHYIEEKKTIANVQNLYKDLKNDSIAFSNMLIIRSKQDSCFKIISRLYDQKKLDQDIPTLYAAHSFIAIRIAFKRGHLPKYSFNFSTLINSHHLEFCNLVCRYT